VLKKDRQEYILRQVNFSKKVLPSAGIRIPEIITRQVLQRLAHAFKQVHFPAFKDQKRQIAEKAISYFVSFISVVKYYNKGRSNFENVIFAAII
jgi:hypothetical protein